MKAQTQLSLELPALYMRIYNSLTGSKNTIDLNIVDRDKYSLHQIDGTNVPRMLFIGNRKQMITYLQGMEDMLSVIKY